MRLVTTLLAISTLAAVACGPPPEELPPPSASPVVEPPVIETVPIHVWTEPVVIGDAGGDHAPIHAAWVPLAALVYVEKTDDIYWKAEVLPQNGPSTDAEVAIYRAPNGQLVADATGIEGSLTIPVATAPPPGGTHIDMLIGP